MTAVPAGAHLSVGHSRRARRGTRTVRAAYRAERAWSAQTVRVSPLVVVLGIFLLALTLFDIVLAVVQLV